MFIFFLLKFPFFWLFSVVIGFLEELSWSHFLVIMRFCCGILRGLGYRSSTEIGRMTLILGLCYWRYFFFFANYCEFWLLNNSWFCAFYPFIMWSKPIIVLELLKGRGRSFCAGGDVVALYNLIREGTKPLLFFILHEISRILFEFHHTYLWDWKSCVDSKV